MGNTNMGVLCNFICTDNFEIDVIIIVTLLLFTIKI